MGILNTPTQTSVPTQAEMRKDRVIRIANQSARNLIQSVRQGIEAIWKAPSPADVLAELGTDAEATFEISRMSIEFLGTIVMGTQHEEAFLELVTLVETIPPFTIHEDGSITID